MREIKFRGEKLYQIEDESILVYGQFEWDAWHKPRIINEHGAFEVKPESIGQYTGLKDKNYTKIYEGDIVKWLGFEARVGMQIRPERIEVVGNQVSSWIESCFRLRNILSTNSTVEVIGNIYENPELLESK